MTITPIYNYRDGVLALVLYNVAVVSTLQVPPFAAGHQPAFNAGAVGDLTGDGFDEFVATFADGNLIVMTANDVDHPTHDVRIVTTQVGNLNKVAIGDFNADGQRDIAGLQVQPDGTLKLLVLTVDPTSLVVTQVNATSVTLASANIPVGVVDIAVGRFNVAAHDQIAIAFANSTGPAIVKIVDFASDSFTPTEKAAFTVTTATTEGYIQLMTGKFGLPNNLSDQLVFHMSSMSQNGRFLQVLAADTTTLALTGYGIVPYDQLPCAFGVQTANFDKLVADPATGQNQRTLNDQIALLYCSNDNPIKPILNIYSVDPATFGIGSPDSNTDLSEVFEVPTTGNGFRIFFTAADLQSRSVTLGDPEIIDITTSDQPSVVIGAPPMHVDFITPNSGTSPILLNLSAIPEGFKTTYQTDTSDEHPYTDSKKTGWSFGAKETFNLSYQLGDLDEGTGSSLSDTLTATQKLKGSIDTINSTFQSHNTSLSASTGMQDWILHNPTSRRVWVYPIIGKKVCPQSKPNCADTDKVQLTMQFTAPTTNAIPRGDDGDDLTWYQPPWEPGNIFSYPANYQQMASMYPGSGKCPSSDGTAIEQTATSLCQLATGVAFATDQSGVTQTTTWTASSTTETDTSFNQNYSFENDLSYTAGIGAKGGVRWAGGLDIDLSGSASFGHTTTDATTLSKSTGLSIAKPDSFLQPETAYRYSVTPYIIGTTVAGGVVDNQPLNTSLQTFGLLRGVFTVDMASAGNAGNWWATAYGSAPDVALNHPARWNFTQYGWNSGPPPSNCLPTGTGSSQIDCMELSDRTPDKPWSSIQQYMRGFFISSANAPGQGPQLQSAKAGDVLTLQARVYNYSLKDMDANTEVRVRFYFTPWNGTAAAGPSVLISEEVTGAIPRFNSALDVNGLPAPPNWVLVPTTFDTGKFDQTKNGGVNVVFWVVVWMQDKTTHQLIKEIPGHGLTAIPPTQPSGSSTLFSTVSSVEECQTDGKCYGNNLGFYPQAFYIFAQSSPGARPPLPRGPVDIGKIDHPARRVTPRDHVPVSATISSATGSTGVVIDFYDGDPRYGGRSFAHQLVPHVPSGASHNVQAHFRSNECGVHQLFAVVNAGTPNEIIRRAPPVQVVCNGQTRNKP